MVSPFSPLPFAPRVGAFPLFGQCVIVCPAPTPPGLGAQSDPTGNGVFVEALMGFNDVLQSLAAHHGDASTVKAKKSGPTLADKEKVM